MDERLELFQNLRTKIQIFSVEHQFHMIPTIEDDIRKSTNEMFHRSEVVFDTELVPSIKVVMAVVQELPKKSQACSKMIQRLEGL